MLRSVKLMALAGVVLGFAGLLISAEDSKPKFTIKQVMKKCMAPNGDKLCAKVAGGKATEEEKKELVAYFSALSLNKPPKGEAGSWKEKCEALVDAAKSGDTAKLKAAANCANCHKSHKK